jgi:phospholipase/carboxylesterase
MKPSVPANPVLHYLVRQPKVKTENPPLIILLHGVGSNERDLFSIAEKLPENFLAISARGPINLSPSRYAWYQVDFSTGKPVINQTQENESRKIILQFISQLKELYRFDDKKIFLGGFSQGAIMSFSIGLTHPEVIHGIAAMSGRILEEVKSTSLVDARLKNLRVFISHGERDNVLPVDYARQAHTDLKTHHIETDYREYQDGHTISLEMINDLVRWLSKI